MEYEKIKASKLKVRWNLRQIWRVTQWKDDCVYRTRSLGIISCTPEYADMLRQDRNIIVGPISTSLMKLIG